MARAIFIVMVIALILPAYMVLAYYRSPDRVARLAISAVRMSDADSLVALASKKETRALNLTPDTVRRFLEEINWDRSAGRMTVKLMRPRPYYDDVLMFDIDVSGISPQGKHRSCLYVYQDPTSGKWRIGLSMLLYALPTFQNDDKDAPGQMWDSLAKSAGITGCTIPAGPTRLAADGSHNDDIKLTLPDE